VNGALLSSVGTRVCLLHGSCQSGVILGVDSFEWIAFSTMFFDGYMGALLTITVFSFA
jgi:hypothetical protein